MFYWRVKYGERTQVETYDQINHTLHSPSLLKIYFLLTQPSPIHQTHWFVSSNDKSLYLSAGIVSSQQDKTNDSCKVSLTFINSYVYIKVICICENPLKGAGHIALLLCRWECKMCILVRCNTALPAELNMIRTCNGQLQFPQLRVCVHLHRHSTFTWMLWPFVLFSWTNS